jgi:hypothetical protein
MFQRETLNHSFLEFQGGNIDIAAEGFLADRKAAGGAQGIIENYRDNLTIS